MANRTDPHEYFAQGDGVCCDAHPLDAIHTSSPRHARSSIWTRNDPDLIRPATQVEAPLQSVLQDWVMRLPLREQGTLLTSVRGCDAEPKQWSRTGVAYSPGRRLTAFIRWCFMTPADSREIDFEEGAFFQSNPPSQFKPSEFGHLPQHWYSHAMHALEVIAYRHPSPNVAGVARDLYFAMVHSLHLMPESPEQFERRLSEDRIASGTVVS